MSDSHLREFVSNWKKNLLLVKHGNESMDKFYADIMDKNTKFESPAIHKPSRDGLYIKTILKWIIEIIEEFHYKDIDYYDYKTNRIALTFGGKIKDPKTNKYLNVEGIDLIRLNKDGTKVIELKVMVRPLNSLILVAQTMKNRFKQLKMSKL